MIDPALAYPSYGVQQADVLLGLTGGFLGGPYDGAAELEQVLLARGRLAEETYQRLREGTQVESRLTCPVFRRRRWKPWRILDSQRLPVLPAYGDGYAFAGTPQISYGLPLGPDNAWPAPPGLAAAGGIADAVTATGTFLLPGPDFTVRATPAGPVLAFQADPFAGGFPVENVGDADRAVTLWVFQPDFDDAQYLYRQWGFVLELAGASSPAYRDTLNAAFDALTTGSSGGQVRAALAALCGAPLAGADGEVVERVAAFAGSLWVFTDRAAYRFAPGARPLVAVGDVVAKYQPLTDALTFDELTAGAVPAGVTQLVLGRDLLTFDADEVVLRDEDVPWEGEVVDGHLKVSAALGGRPEAVAAFWDQVHARGLAEGKTLAEYLDVRPAAARTTPVALENLPPTVNPLRFLVAQLFRYNLFLVRVRSGGCTAGARGLLRADVLRRIVPPETLAYVIVYLPDVVTAGGAGSAASAEVDPANPVVTAGGAGTPDALLRDVAGVCD